MRSEVWIVRHDAMPSSLEFTYSSEEEAREAYEKSKFYDPANGWGVVLIHRITETEVLDSTKPKAKAKAKERRRD